MAVLSTTIAQDASTDAGWIAWGTAIHNALVALGTLVQTADTGQVNWATITTRSTVYEVWRFNDANQGAAPCFIKIFYWQTGSQPRFRMTVSTGTDGAGTPTGNISDTLDWSLTFTATAQSCLFSSTPSRLTMWLEADGNHGAGTNGVFLSVERPHNNVGAELSTGIQFAFFWPGHGNYYWLAAPGRSPATAAGVSDPSKWIIWPGISAAIGAQCTVFTLNGLGENFQVQNAMLGMAAYWAGDIPVGVGLPSAPLPLTLYGASHAYVNPSAAMIGFGTGAQYLMLYE